MNKRIKKKGHDCFWGLRGFTVGKREDIDRGRDIWEKLEWILPD